MTGWLIVNEYLNTEKFIELQDLFIEASKKRNVNLYVHSNAEFVVDSSNGRVLSKAFDEYPDFIIFYDKDICLAEGFERMEIPVFNSAEAIKTCDSKLVTVEKIREYKSGKINTPKTFKVPFSYENIGISNDADFSFLEIVEEELMACSGNGMAYPMIIKECYSSFGMGVHLANNRDEAISLICKFGNKECLIQQYIECSSGVDVRLQMVGSKCVASMMRKNDKDFRANITNGGKMCAYEPTEDDLELAEDVMECLDLSFAGIDIMHDELGQPVFCEANSNAHFKNLYDLTGINCAEYMIEYILERI
ncbi:MAG: RimK family alpha-L-glutamate ligase [Lachnospiraceae bacterium]|nr:RimK family alpha-L-glutamate ligase [Lachnospiraceae bacterium]